MIHACRPYLECDGAVTHQKHSEVLGYDRCCKTNNLVDVALLEHCVREELNLTAPRVMGVLHPLKSCD